MEGFTLHLWLFLNPEGSAGRGGAPLDSSGVLGGTVAATPVPTPPEPSLGLWALWCITSDPASGVGAWACDPRPCAEQVQAGPDQRLMFITSTGRRGQAGHSLHLSLEAFPGSGVGGRQPAREDLGGGLEADGTVGWPVPAPPCPGVLTARRHGLQQEDPGSKAASTLGGHTHHFCTGLDTGVHPPRPEGRGAGPTSPWESCSPSYRPPHNCQGTFCTEI